MKTSVLFCSILYFAGVKEIIFALGMVMTHTFVNLR